MTDQNFLFFGGIAIELFPAAERALAGALPNDEEDALMIAFEEVFHRIDFENRRVIPSHDGEHKVSAEGLKFTTIVLLFGNFLAQRGIFLTETPAVNQ